MLNYIKVFIIMLVITISGCQSNKIETDKKITVNYQIINLKSEKNILKEDLNNLIKLNKSNIISSLNSYGEFEVQTEAQVYVKDEKIPLSSSTTSEYTKDVKAGKKITGTYNTDISSEVYAKIINDSEVNIELNVNIKKLTKMETYRVGKTTIQNPVIKENSFQINTNIMFNETTIVSINNIDKTTYQLLIIKAETKLKNMLY